MCESTDDIIVMSSGLSHLRHNMFNKMLNRCNRNSVSQTRKVEFEDVNMYQVRRSNK